jgi:hypothetical protein
MKSNYLMLDVQHPNLPLNLMLLTGGGHPGRLLMRQAGSPPPITVRADIRVMGPNSGEQKAPAEEELDLVAK